MGFRNPGQMGMVNGEGRRRIDSITRKDKMDNPNPYYDFSEADLRDTGKLIRLWEFLAKTESSPVGESELDRLDVIACAERALELGKPPLRLFRWLLANFSRAKELLSNGQEQRAAERLAAWNRFQYQEPAT